VRGRLSLVLLGCAVLSSACATSGRRDSTVAAAYVARTKLADDLVSRGDWGRAFVMLDELHRDRPDDAHVLTMRGIVYRERGLFADAENDLRAAVKATPGSAPAHAALGILYDVQLRPEAEVHHREAVRLEPNNPAYLNNLGFSLYLRQKFREAIAEYDQAARLAPLSRRVRTNLGFACAAMGDLRRAAREFQMGGSESEAKNNLGFAYERRGDMNNAYQLYLEAVRLDPAADHARRNLVHAAAMLGRPVPPEGTPPVAVAPPAPEPAAPAVPTVPKTPDQIPNPTKEARP
jgi:Flp pilus assembly protein TadD